MIVCRGDSDRCISGNPAPTRFAKHAPRFNVNGPLKNDIGDACLSQMRGGRFPTSGSGDDQAVTWQDTIPCLLPGRATGRDVALFASRQQSPWFHDVVPISSVRKALHDTTSADRRPLETRRRTPADALYRTRFRDRGGDRRTRLPGKDSDIRSRCNPHRRGPPVGGAALGLRPGSATKCFVPSPW